MRTAPRTMLCATDFQAQSGSGKPGPVRGAPRAVQRVRGQGLAGHRHDRAGHRAQFTGRAHEASRLASEQMALLESIGDPNLTLGLAFVRIHQLVRRGRVRRAPAVVADRHRPRRGRPHQGRRLRYGVAPGGGVGVPRRCPLVAGPSWVAARLRRCLDDGAKQRRDNSVALVAAWCYRGDLLRGTSSRRLMRWRYAKKPCRVRKATAAISH